MSNIEEMLQEVESYLKLNKNDLFVKCVETRLNQAQVQYYRDLQKKFDAVYYNIIGKQDAKALKALNIAIMKQETKWGEANGK